MTSLVPALLSASAAAEPPGELSFRPFGYVDVGWFDAAGDGTSYREVDPLLQNGPCPRSRGGLDGEAWIERWRRCEIDWVFTGDPWAATVNSQGDLADYGNAYLTNSPRPDRIVSGGRPTFLVNAVEAGLDVGREGGGGGATGARAALRVEPTDDLAGEASEWVWLDIAHVWWAPNRDLTLRAGRIESVFGREWFHRRAPDRWNVTPSLMARYTTGTPLGISAEVDRRALELGASLTTGSTTTEKFGLFHEDGADDNGAPTATGRVMVRTGGRAGRLAVGVSGQAGAQDELERRVPMLQVGGDLELQVGRVTVWAEYLVVDQDQGGVRGPSDPAAWAVEPRLFAHGGYVLGLVDLGGFVRAVARVDRRTGTIELTAPEVDHVYLSDVVRFTGGVSWQPTVDLVLTAEGIRIVELLGEEIPNDVVTTSVVFHWQ